MDGAHGAIGHDPAGVKGEQIAGHTIRRAAGFARPYRAMLIGFAVALSRGTMRALVPPLLLRQIFDEATSHLTSENEGLARHGQRSPAGSAR